MSHVLGTRAVIEGYASVFGVPDLSGDVVRRGAFGGLIPARVGRVRMLAQHAAEAPVGRWVRMEEDAHGLKVRGEVFTDTSAGRDLHRLLRGGALDGLSIGFKPVRARRTRTGREILEADLWEVSIVTFPMAPGARIHLVGDEVGARTTFVGDGVAGGDEEMASRPPRDLLRGKA